MNGDILAIADAAAFVAAIDQELAELGRDHVDQVRKGRLTQHEADYVVGLLRDIRSDLAHAFGPLSFGQTIERSDPAAPWRNKVRWITGELERRRADYPELIAKGRILNQDARVKIKMLATLHRLYWRELFMWEPEAGPALEWLNAIRRHKSGDTAAIDRAIPLGRATMRELARKHQAAVAVEDGQAQGELVAA